MLKIVHLGDIHIQDRRREEYAAVFETLYAMVRAENPTIIVVAGDVFDSKTRATAHNIEDVAAFLSSLCDIAPVVMIPGNHDTNIAIAGDLDLLTPVVTNHIKLQRPRLTYLRNTGAYFAHGVLWVVVAPDGPKPTAAEIDAVAAIYPADTPRICLFHEEVDGAKYPNGTIMRDHRLSPRDFLPYDATLGGHIHLRGPVAERAAYCGSLIQQNFGESHTGHGFLVWEIEKSNTFAPHKTAKPTLRGVDVPNKLGGYLRVLLSATGVDATARPLPDAPTSWELVHDAAAPAERVAEAASEYETLYGKPPRAIRIDGKTADQAIVADEKKDPVAGVELARAQLDAKSIDAHSALIREALGEEHPRVDAVVALHAERYGAVTAARPGRARIRLLRLEFGNLYCYGPENVVDFTKLEGGLSGVVAPNFAGKSSLIDIIIFALYDKHPRSATKSDILNANARSYHLALDFELDGKTGRITKEATGTSRKMVCNIEYAGENRTRGTTPDTLREIAQIVGTAEDALATAIMTQGAEMGGIVGATPLDRRKCLSELLALGDFAMIEKATAKELTAANGEVKALTAQFGGETEDELNLAQITAAGDADDAVAAAKKIQANTDTLRDKIGEHAAALARAVSAVATLRASAEKAETLARSAGKPTSASEEEARAALAAALAAVGHSTPATAAAELARRGVIRPPPSVEQDAKFPSESETDTSIAAATFYATTNTTEALTIAAAEADTEVEQAAASLKQRTETAGGAIAGKVSPIELKSAKTRVAQCPETFSAADTDTDVARQTLAHMGIAPADSTKTGMALIEELRTDAHTKFDMRAGARISISTDYLEPPVDLDAANAKALEAKKAWDELKPDALRAESLTSVLGIKIKGGSLTAAIRDFGAETLDTWACGSRKQTVQELAQELAKLKTTHAAAVGAAPLRERLCPVEGCPGCASALALLSPEGAAAIDIEIKDMTKKVMFAAMTAIAVEERARRAHDEASMAVVAGTAHNAKCAAAVIAALTTLENAEAVEATSDLARLESALAAQARDDAATALKVAVAKVKKAQHALDNARQIATGAAAKAAATTALRCVGLRAVAAAARDVGAHMAAANMASTAAALTAGLASEGKSKTTHDKALALFTKIQATREALSCKAAVASATAIRLEMKLAAEQKRSAALAEATTRAETLSAYRSVIRANGGISDRLLERARRDLEKAINSELAQTGARFTVEIDETFNMRHGPPETVKLPVSLASGYQKFALGLAARAALWRLADIPLPDCIIIDEGFAACDDENLEKMSHHIEALAGAPGAPRLVFIVSHLDVLKVRVERPLTITIERSGSCVRNDGMIGAVGAGAAAVPANPTVALAAPPAEDKLEQDPDNNTNVMCAYCKQSIRAAWKTKHLKSAKHLANVAKHSRKK